MYLNGMGLRAIERVTEIHHTIIMSWVREAGHCLRDAPEAEEIPEVRNWSASSSRLKKVVQR